MLDYSYVPLKDDEIRIIRLQAGEGEDILSCKFNYCILSPQHTPPIFSALSYTWGNEIPTHLILLEQQSFCITKKLASALYHFRQERGRAEVLLWVDAICINQDDLAEKSVQIGRMRTIYESALNVVCWLGERTAIAHNACKTLDKLFALLPQEADTSNPSMRLLKEYTPILHSHISDQEWAELSYFFTNPWWYRVWVLQEATTRRRQILRYGSWALTNLLPLRWVEALAERVAEQYPNRPNWSIGDSAVFRIVMMGKARNGKLPNKLTLLDVLGACRGLGASNPRDYVYAALNMTSDTRVDELKPDYTLSVAEVFIDSVEWFFNASTSVFDMLGYVESRLNTSTFDTQETATELSREQNIDPQEDTTSRNLPTYTPDWAATYTHHPFTKKIFMGCSTYKNYYTASGPYSGKKVQVQLTNNRRVLRVRGFSIGSIKELKDPGPNTNKMDYATELSWRPLASEGMYHTGESFDDAYLRTVVADMTYLHGVDRRRGGKMNWDEHELFGTALKCATFGRRFAFTEQGHMGLVRQDVEAGDEVFVILGGEVLYVLRPVGSYYLFVGECYMHGLMDGEAMEWVLDGRAAVSDIAIR
ncbi:hypothetical protein MMC13_001976 [Lambiella insularis]|nr:hypothetical protein [Lambiella insularis]